MAGRAAGGREPDELEQQLEAAHERLLRAARARRQCMPAELRKRDLQQRIARVRAAIDSAEMPQMRPLPSRPPKPAELASAIDLASRQLETLVTVTQSCGALQDILERARRDPVTEARLRSTRRRICTIITTRMQLALRLLDDLDVQLSSDYLKAQLLGTPSNADALQARRAKACAELGELATQLREYCSPLHPDDEVLAKSAAERAQSTAPVATAVPDGIRLDLVRSTLTKLNEMKDTLQRTRNECDELSAASARMREEEANPCRSPPSVSGAGTSEPCCSSAGCCSSGASHPSASGPCFVEWPLIGLELLSPRPSRAPSPPPLPAVGGLESAGAVPQALPPDSARTARALAEARTARALAEALQADRATRRATRAECS